MGDVWIAYDRTCVVICGGQRRLAWLHDGGFMVLTAIVGGETAWKLVQRVEVR